MRKLWDLSRRREVRRTQKFFKNIGLGVIWRVLTALGHLGIKRVFSFVMLTVVKETASGSRGVATTFPIEPALRAPSPASKPLADCDHYPGLGYSELHNALVASNRRVSSVVVGSELVVPWAAAEGPLNIKVGEPATGGILRQEGDKVLATLRPTGERIREAIFVGSWTPSNWYHWVIDTLPSVYLANMLPREFSNWPILIPEEALGKKAWLEPLRLALQGRPVLPLVRDEYHKIDHLVWVDSPTSPGPLPLREAGEPRYRMHTTAMLNFRAHMIKTALANPQSDTEVLNDRVFLARREGSERAYNQEQLISVARDFGYTPVFLESLSFEESVSVFRAARRIIGPHGAGWANLIFSSPGLKALMWTWELDSPNNWYQNVATLAGARMRVISCDGGSEQPFDLGAQTLVFHLSEMENERPSSFR